MKKCGRFLVRSAEEDAELILHGATLGVAVAKELLRETGLRHPQRICADQTSVPSAGNQSGITPAQQPNRQL